MARNGPNGMERIVTALPVMLAATACHQDASAHDRNKSTMAIHAFPTPAPRATTMLLIEIAHGRWRVRLDESAATRDLLTQLPLTLTLEDFGATEKIAMLPRKLRHDDAPEGMTPVTGDLAYYAPWGNLAIFRKDFRYSAGLVRLGRIADPLAALQRNGTLKVTLRAAPPPDDTRR